MRRKNIKAFLLVLVMLLSVLSPAAFAETVPLPEYSGDWTSFRGNFENMGITSAKTPISAADVKLKWATALQVENPLWGGYYTAVPPIIVNDSLYTALDNKVVKMSCETGEILSESGELAGSVGYSYMPIGYGGGMIFVQVGNGRIQALHADTLESLWISEQTETQGQTISPITYKDGKIYTGSWKSETGVGEYFCITVDDEVPESGDEEKQRDWTVSHTGGFYWSGAYVTDTYVVFGGDDGQAAGSQSDSAVLYSVDTQTGAELDKIESLHGDIRSSIAYDTETDRIYFSTKGGALYQVKVNTDGTFDDTTLKRTDLGSASTATPIVFDGLIYVGVQNGGNLADDIKIDGPAYVVVNAENMQVIKAVAVPAYAQASGLLSTAFKGDTGKVYIYTTYNNNPGGIYVIEAEKSVDESGALTVSATGSDLFIPADELQNYCICSLICDDEGTIYYKNDSGFMIALRREKSGNAITEFKIGSSIGIIDENNNTINITLPAGTDLTALMPQIKVSDGAEILPASEATVDFTSPVTYTVTAENGEIRQYTVTAQIQIVSSGGTTVVKPKNITVCISVEKFVLGQGFIAGPVFVDTTERATVADVLQMVLDENGIDYTAQTENGFYMSGIADSGEDTEIPEYIMEYLGSVKGRADSEMLSEFDYSDTSGWLYTVNNKKPNKGADSYKLKDGDAIRWQFSLCGMGADIVGGNGLLKPADKDNLLCEIAELNQMRNLSDLLKIGENQQKYDNALYVLTKMDSTQKDVTDALKELRNLDTEEEEKLASDTEKADNVSSSEKDEEENNNVEEKPLAPLVAFSDIKYHWAKEFIEILASKGIISGRENGEFAPDENITRAEVVSILYRLSGESSEAVNAFDDVNQDDWFAAAVCWAAGNGIASGMSTNEFAPNEKITREQMAVILYRYINFAKLVFEEQSRPEFEDVNEISAWAREGVSIMQRIGIISGKGDSRFEPKANATRAEAARILSALIIKK